MGQPGEALRLPEKTALKQLVVGNALLLAQTVGNEDGAALTPVYLRRDLGQGEVAAGEVQGVPALYPVHEQGAEVPLEGPGVVKPAELLVQAGGEGVAVQINEGVGIHKNSSFQSGQPLCYPIVLEGAKTVKGKSA